MTTSTKSEKEITVSNSGPVTEKKQPEQQPKMISIPEQEYAAMAQTNQNALIMTMQTIEKIDEILDECARFEAFIREQKAMAKRMFNSATRDPPPSPSGPAPQEQQQQQQQS